MQILQSGVVATETKLGWTVMGPAIGNDMEDSCLIVTSLHVNSFDVQDLWKLDVLGIMDAAETKSRKDLIEASNTHFKETVKRDESGRYIVSLPWIAGHPPVPVNRRTTENRLLTTTRNVQGKMLYEEYDTIFEEWEKEKIIEEVEDKWEECNYLPHRPVLKDSHTTPIRPVFDASCKKKGLPSLNQCLEKGDNLIELIPDLLLRFRLGKYGIIADIRKAFLQIQVREEDREFLRFLWWKKDQKTLKFYRHCRVVFGLTSSPFLLAATIKYHLSLPQFQDNRCAELLARSFYVDNCILSLSSTHDVKKFIKESSDIMRQAKFELRDWMWNEPGITEQDPASILGMKWHLQTDTIAINVQSLKNIDEEKSITKRSILSACHRIFDPIQFTCPATIKIKKMVQDAWKENKSWDEPLNEDRRVEFIKWRKQALELDQIKIPRWILPIKGRTTLHVFCDASAIAYATVIFMRIENASVIVVRFVEARNRLATIKRITIPRLELLACLIGARLLVHVLENLEESPEKIQCWTDSSPALYWIQQQENWAQFVSNRVKEITTLTKNEDWNHVAGEHNPADLPSRGESPSKFIKSGWWEGPKWLQEKKEDWPVSKVQYDLEAIEEERRKTVVAGFVAKKPEENPWYLNLYEGKREVTLTQILRVIAWMIRFKPSEYKGDVISQEELDSAEKSLVKIIQSESIGEEDPKMKQLHAFQDKEGLWRVKTRIVNRNDDELFRLPILIPTNHPVTELIVKSVHEKMYHCGAQTLRSVLREKFWIPKARQLVRHVIHKCPRCRRFEAKRVDVPEASLPQHRVRDVVVFEVTGIDLGGPLYLEDGQKVWFVIFTCGVYRAVHLELVTSLSTEALVGAVESWTPNELYRVNFGVKWKLNPPAAPWWGGWIERIVGLTKKLLRRLLGKRVVNYEEMVTILENCERVINARPLTYIAEDNDDLVPLTPEMCNFGKSYEKRKRLLKDFRKRFRSEYLGLLVHHDNRKKQRQLKVGDIVLVEVENRKQINWPMGKITKVFPGTDNVRRLVEVKTKSGFMKREVQRLFPLEVPSEDVEQGDGELKPAEDEIVREKTSGVESTSAQEKTIPGSLVVMASARLKLEEDKDMQQHITTMMELVDKLRTIGETLKDSHITAILLCSLPKSYSNLITMLESRPDDELTLEFTKNKLLDEHTRRVESSKDESTGSKALKSLHGASSQRREKEKKFCSFCHKPNHSKEECWHYQKRNNSNKEYKYENFRRGNVPKYTNQSSVTQEQSTNQRTTKGPNPKALNCTQREASVHNWFIDSGATSHMAYDESFFTELNREQTQNVVVANGNKLQVKGIGQGEIKVITPQGKTDTLLLTKVLYIPELTDNLLSVSAATSNGCKVTFNRDWCTIERDNTALANGILDNGMYRLHLDDNPQTRTFKANVAKQNHCKNKNCLMLWHDRLGHRNIESIKKIRNENLARGLSLNNCSHSTDCVQCIQGKLTETPFPKKTEYRATETLQLVHSDICGPLPTNSLSGKRYFITFTDDYSRYTKTYLLKGKDEAYEKIKDYVISAHTEFGKNIQTIRTDNGREYVNRQVEDFLNQSGIKHQLTVPYSPAQNGVAERKNRSLMEMTRCMLFDSGLPQSLWAEAVTTANYLHNRIPSKATDKTPFELWTNRKPSLKHLKRFGCKAFAYIPKIKRNKLDSKVIEGIFLGYDDRSKGYRILHDTDNITISRSVKFLEKENGFHLASTKTTSSQVLSTDLTSSNHIGNAEESQEPGTQSENLEDSETEDYLQPGTSTGTQVVTQRRSTRPTKGIPPIRNDYMLYKTEAQAINEETFAPIVKHSTIRAFLAASVYKGMQVIHLDVKTAFLHGDLDKELYMELPEGLHTKQTNEVCKLKKAIYGLKQAGRSWNTKIASTLIKNNFKQSIVDPCLFTKNEENHSIYLILYVDDMLLASDSEIIIQNTVKTLEKEFEIKNLGDPTHFIGIEISRNREGELLLSQKNKIQELVERYNLQEAKPTFTPIESGYPGLSDEKLLPNNVQYQQLIGSLLYLSVVSRPDIAAPVCILSSRNQNPRNCDWNAAKRIVRYLKTTKELELRISNQKPPTLEAYSDATWASDNTDRKSLSGNLFLLGSNPISWMTGKQGCVSLSSTEAELISAAEASQELLWLLDLLKDLELEQKAPIYFHQDNQSCLKICSSKKVYSRTKHIATKIHHLKDLQKKTVIKMIYCPTGDMKADILTKPLPRPTFEKLRYNLVIHGCCDLHFRRLTSGFHRCAKAKTSLEDDDVPIDDTTTKPLFTPQENGRKAYGDDVMSRRRVFEWYKRFKEGREETADNERSGRPSTSTTPEKVDKVLELDILGVRRLNAVLVPKDLTFDQKIARKETASLNLEATTDFSELLKRVITGDETWIYGFNSETTQQASEWRFKNEPRPKKARKAPSKVKVMLTVFFDYQGIVHHEFQQQGSTITADSYLGFLRRLREAIRQKRPELWRSKSWILHHDNAPAHTALKISKFLQIHSTSAFPQHPYSPDLAP
ncbi:hypothetical protein LAZ67_3005902 [Cordylochernes scorpioides]|uniref:Integrase catalytic domain-containing protein n=1 Tax=Cordylochernes scorpioides TaxID=51811 RepID=A0ABY6KAY4_9ARAC|nr:hypothetical protein LAZ67_3005902 [Cordylochernes scorpioides]